MIIAHYATRLPGNYDLGRIRTLTRERAPVWDARPELYFKAFLLREAGHFGAIANNFSSLYLWRQDGAYRDWLVSGGFAIVSDRFGRAEIETRFALDARRGRGHQARFATTEDIDIPLDTDLAAAFAREIERNRKIAARSDMVAAAALAWIPETGNSPVSCFQPASRTATRTAIAWQILHLARPLLDALPSGEDRAPLRQARSPAWRGRVNRHHRCPEMIPCRVRTAVSMCKPVPYPRRTARPPGQTAAAQPVTRPLAAR